MKLFEYEAKNILKRKGLRVPAGQTAHTPDEAFGIASGLARAVMVKSQVKVSGRGKAGGILSAATPDEAALQTVNLIGKRIKDIPVGSVLIEEKLDIQQQFYVSLAIDRQAKKFVFLTSASGGVDIEEVARESPERIARYYVNPLVSLGTEQTREALAGLTLSSAEKDALAAVLVILYEAAREYDAELVELNPLARTAGGEWIAADARITLDDNAIFRHPEFNERNLQREEDTPREAEARRQKYSYVDLDGDIGIVGNGAGLVMATIDLVQYFGGRPANFLDIGGGAQVDVIKNGLLLVMNKPGVKAVLINILGGITRCDLVATGVVEGLRAAAEPKPIAVRMMGTNEKEGQEILHLNGIGYYPDMEQAAAAIIRHSRP